MTREELMREIEAAVRGHHIASCRSTVLPCESFKAGALFLVDRVVKAEQERDQLLAGILEKDELIKEGLAVDAGLRARIGNLREALEKCREHVQLDDPNWGSLTALAFASRCGLVEIEANQALAADKEQT